MKRTPLKAMSDRRRAEQAAYDNLREKLLAPVIVQGVEYQPRCEAFTRWLRAGEYRIARRCTIYATELHHLRKRSSAGALANPANVVRVCHECNMAVEDHPEEAHAAGLVVREGDPEWEALSARAWRLGRG